MKVRERKESQENSGESSGSWMVTFSDLSTLLLTFFVLLLSMSSMDDRALKSAFVNFDRTSGILFFKEDSRIMMPRDIVIRDIAKSLESVHVLDIRNLDEIENTNYTEQDFNFLVSSGNALWIKKRPDSDDFSFIFGSQLMFEGGSAQLKPDAYPLLQKLGDFLTSSKYQAYIDGHTDDIPINTSEFSSNEELSLERAKTILNFMVEQVKVPPEKLALGAYGGSHPLMDNDSPEGRAMNRRAEIIFHQAN